MGYGLWDMGATNGGGKGGTKRGDNYDRWIATSYVVGNYS